MYIDHHGDMEIINHSTKDKVILTFKQSGWSKKHYQQVTGQLQCGNTFKQLQGKWSDKLVMEDKTLWKCNSVELNKSDFNLPPFALALNELNEDLRKQLCTTDCRFRPDQRAMEEGRYDIASTEKTRLEEKQRARRKTAEHDLWQPKWFIKETCPDTGNTYWKFTNQYWIKRELQDWNGCLDLF